MNQIYFVRVQIYNHVISYLEYGLYMKSLSKETHLNHFIIFYLICNNLVGRKLATGEYLSTI